MKFSSILAAGFLVISTASVRAETTHWKFDFTGGKATDGYTQVSPTAEYSKEQGFGFESGAKVQVLDRGDGGAGAHIITSDSPFYFSADVPEGNYKITVTLGDPKGESTTTVKAELRRLMLEHVHTDAGQQVTKSFVVNVRTPKISTGGNVHLKSPRETTNEAWAWDERITLEFSDAHPCVSDLQIEKVDVPTIYILGDSTVCDQSKEPYASWGQMITRFFQPDIAVANHAESGETYASSTGAKRLDKVLSVMKPGDYLLMQFGHNDMKSKAADAPQQYKANIRKWVKQVKEKGGIPVVITPMNRHSFEGDKVTNSLKEYPDMAREAAKEEDVAMIDLNAMSKTLYEALGPKPSIQLFEHNADASKFDGTHHSPYGAYELAKCVVVGIQQAKLDIAAHISKDFHGFDPAKPDALAQFDVPPSPGLTADRPLGD